jgi:electron transfer flavoprotein beta subunit
MGADRAILLTDPAFGGSDTLATARVLAAATEKLGHLDLILCGAFSYHGNTGQVGPQLAELLDLPCVTFVTRIELGEDHKVWARSEWENSYRVVEAELPVLLTVSGTLNRPRGVSLTGLVAARGKELLVWTAADVGVLPTEVGLAGSPTRVVGVTSIETKRARRVVEGEPGEVVRCLLEELGPISGSMGARYEETGG